MAAEFIKGPDFRQGIFDLHPNLEKLKEIDKGEEVRRVINEYFDKFYQINKKELESVKEDFQKEWSREEDRYFEVVDGLFPGFELPRDDYKGFLSIINCNPRFLENKTFQVYYEHQMGVRYVTAHELLHFVFYDYTKANFSDLFEGADPNQGLWWDLAELFNEVVLSLDKFREVHGQEKVSVYPKHEEYIEEFIKLWENCDDIDGFIEKAYKKLSE